MLYFRLSSSVRGDLSRMFLRIRAAVCAVSHTASCLHKTRIMRKYLCTINKIIVMLFLMLCFACKEVTEGIKGNSCEQSQMKTLLFVLGALSTFVHGNKCDSGFDPSVCQCLWNANTWNFSVFNPVSVSLSVRFDMWQTRLWQTCSSPTSVCK